jgi:LmbE family N-acetylglucosaminyl deacetylase
MSKTERVTNTDGLLTINRMAQALNRNVDQKWLQAVLDPDGKHLLVLMLPFHNEQDHHRCRVLAKVAWTSEPVDFMLDVPVNLWLQMETAEEHLAT